MPPNLCARLGLHIKPGVMCFRIEIRSVPLGTEAMASRRQTPFQNPGLLLSPCCASRQLSTHILLTAMAARRRQPVPQAGSTPPSLASLPDDLLLHCLELLSQPQVLASPAVHPR